MKVRLTGSIGISGKFYSAGDVVDVNNTLAANLLFRKKAVEYVPEAEKPKRQRHKPAEKQEAKPVQEAEVKKHQETQPDNSQGEQEEVIEEYTGEEQGPDVYIPADFERDQLIEMAAECGLDVPDDMSDAEIQAMIRRHLAEQG